MNKLIELLKKLSAVELRWFVEYVKSPFFNKHQNLIKLIELLYEAAPLYESKTLDKKNLFKYIFPHEKYKEQKVSDLASYLVDLLENFMAYLNYEKQPVLQKQLLLKELRERELDKFFQSNLRELRKKTDAYSYRDEFYYHNRFLAETESDAFFIKKGSRERNDSLQKKVDSLDLFYLSVKLRNSCEMINRQNIISSKYNLRMLDNIISYLNKHPEELKDVPSITIYHRILLTLTESENEIHYTRLKELLAEHARKFSIEESRQMYDYAQNYCIKKINQGNAFYAKEIFSLYKLLLENEIIFEGKYLSQWDYKNIVSIAIRLKEFEWTKKFMEQYKEKIAAEFRNNAYTYNLASYYYSKEEYKSALKLLQEVEFTDVFYHLGSKSMLLKMYYELEETEALYSLIDTFKMYLNRNKLISDYQQETHYNLVKYTKKVYNFKINSGNKSSINKTEIQALKNKIVSAKNISNLQWLIEKIEELWESK